MASTERPTKRRRINFDDFATVLVGAEEKRFSTYRDVLIRTSTFFTSALTGNCWREAKEKVVRLPEHDPRAFSIYLDWLYNGSVDLSDGDDTAQWTQKEDVTERAGPRYTRLIDCYSLGDYLGDDEFRNALIGAYFDLRTEVKHWPSFDECNRASRELPEDSKFTMLITHHALFSSDRESFAEAIKELNPELMRGMALAAYDGLCSMEKNKSPWQRGKQFYYIVKKQDRA